MNVATRLALFAYFATAVSLIALHYPFDGYRETVVYQKGDVYTEWHDERPGCTGEARSELESFRRRDEVMRQALKAGKSFTTQQLVAWEQVAMGIKEKCETVGTTPDKTIEQPFTQWVSVGALVPWLASGKAIVVFGVVSTLIAGALLLAVRRRAT